jgi:hypothetical protein
MRGMSVAATPRFLFVPVSGPGGAGEYHRALAVARGAERRWPGCEIRFVLNTAAPYAASAPYPGLRLDDSPTRSNAAVCAYVRSVRPDVVVFDSAGRQAQYAAAREVGAAVVYVSSRPKTRWKGFRWRRMRLLDQHWIAQPRILGGAPGPYEQLKLRVLGRPELVFLDTVHEPVDAAAVRDLQARLQLEPGRYVVLCPGGGGDFGTGPDPAAVFAQAAELLQARLDCPVVAVLGAGARAAAADSPTHAGRTLTALPNGVLLGLIHDAAVAAVNGGSLLLQSVAQGTPLVAAPIAGDQAARIRRCADFGCVRELRLEPRALAEGVAALLDDAPARAAMRAGAGRMGLHNGVDTAMEAIERLLCRREAHTEVLA